LRTVYTATLVGENSKLGQTNIVANYNIAANPKRTTQVLFRLYINKMYITSRTVKELQASFTILQFLPTYNIAQREDENFIMIYDQQKENAGYTQAYNQGLQLLLQGIIPQSEKRHPEENYWAMMQIFDNTIADKALF
ncbi:6377_t:CDS:1, partial [Gigaspora margarita]